MLYELVGIVLLILSFHTIVVLTKCARYAQVELPKSKSESTPSLAYHQAHQYQNRENCWQHCPPQWWRSPRLHELGSFRTAQTNARHIVARNNNPPVFQ